MIVLCRRNGNDRQYQITCPDYVGLQTKSRLFDSGAPDHSPKHGPSPYRDPQLTSSCYFHVQLTLAHRHARL